MKHGIGIVAHKAKPQLRWLVEHLLEAGFILKVHLDQKNLVALKSMLQGLEHTFTRTSIKVYRGHVSIVKASLLLMNEFKDLDIQHFHLISAEDIPVKSPAYIQHFFNSNSKAEFININELPVKDKEEEGRSLFNDSSVFKDRIPLDNYRFTSLMDGMALVTHYQFPKSKLMKRINRHLGKYRSYWKCYHFFMKRRQPDLKFYIGSAWFSISFDLMKYFLDVSEHHPELLRYFNFVGYPDEIYFQTLAMQSPFAENIVNSDLRYIDWSKPVHGGPGFLHETDLAAIVRSNGIFARKWNFNTKEEFDKTLNTVYAKSKTNQ